MAEHHTLAAMRYVELNPVRAGLVGAPEDWPWSSARANLDIGRDLLVSRNITRELVSDWRSYLDETIEDGELDLLRKQTQTGKPLGDERFLDMLERRTGRRLRRDKQR